MKALNLLISKTSCGYWLLLFFVLLNFSWKNAQAQSGSSKYEAIPISISSCGNGSFSDYQDTSYDFYDNYGYPSPDIWYTFTLTGYTDVAVSLCGSNIDTHLYILNPSGYLLAYNNDNGPLCNGSASSIYQRFAPGTYYIVAEGYNTDAGGISLNFDAVSTGPAIAGSGMSNAINAGTFNSSGSYSDSRSNADDCLGDHIGQPNNDIYYQFTLTAESLVTLSHCGSGFDTYMHLLDGSGTMITTNDDNSGPACPGVQAYIQMTLSAGTYYVVSEGNNTNVGNIVTNINVAPVSSALACVEASQNQNYVITYVPREPGFTTVTAVTTASCDPVMVQTGIQYFDGLGRPLQTVQVKGSPDKKDIVVPIAYDEFGREAKKYLPYMHDSNNGAYKTDGLTKVIDYYAGQPAGQAVGFNTPFSETRFESSPLNRVLEQGAPGESWQIGSGHTVQTSHKTNDAGEVSIWTVSEAGGATVTSPYNARTLYKTVSKDENGNENIEYKDLQGKVVLKKVQDGPGSYISTYYVYDDLGNLKYVLPPAVSVNSFTEADAVFLNYIYGYKYDGRNRLIKKKIPGKGWESLVYNQLDQVVATQDAMQAGNNFWTFTKYDGLGRVILTGEVTDTRDQAGLAAHLVGALSNWESRNITLTEGYTQESWPQSWNKLYAVNYYDNYDIPNNLGSNYYSTASDVTMTMTKGLLTATKVRNLESGVMYWTVNYYNERGELRESVTQHHLEGTDRLVNSYKFTGELESSVRTHSSSTVAKLVITNAYTYDHMGRKKQSWQRTGTGNANVLLSELEYSGTGQLLHKKLHSNLQDVAYSYNERGWLHSQSSALFSQSLRYANPQLGALPQYNGNISEQVYTAAIGGTQSVTYGYDALNRLKDGNSSAGFSETGITYDKMGNLLSLTRSGKGSLSYDLYEGNQLKTLSGYKNGTFTYNLNGNLEIDGMRGVSIGYNYLNLPSTVTGSVNLNYTYDATGRKLRKVSSTTGTSDYVSGIHYENNDLKFIQTVEGRAIKSGNDYNYEYTLTDHLGNNRVTFDTFGGIVNKVGEEDYYPFGLNQSRQLNAGNNYLYNKKEVQKELEQYDYGARFYDPVIGRWNVVDPMAEKFYSVNPYNYTDNNPGNNIDPNGMETYYGAEAQDLFRQMQGSIGGQYDKGKKVRQDDKPEEPKSTNQERQKAYNSWIENLIKLNQLMLDVMELKLFSEAFAETFPAKAKAPIPKFVSKKPVVQFGNPETSNQVSHANRHLEAAGLNVEKVKEAIITNLKPASSYKVYVRIIGKVIVDGVKIEYSGTKLPNGTINIGSIKPPRL